MFDVSKNKLVTEYNSIRCNKPIPPDSTFKIALSLMAFDQKLITQGTIFKWDGKDRGLSAWNQDQTPQVWLKNSTVWVSQELTPKLGMKKIKCYLNKFNYGNQNFSGDPGKNNGLTNAWLSSSLKISAAQQLAFLKALIGNKLPVSQIAMRNTKANMYLETSPNGWKLYGKTGAGSSVHQLINNQGAPQDSWFVGFVEKNDKRYIFVLNFTDLKEPSSTEAGGNGTIAKVIAKNLLAVMKLY